MAIPPPRGPGSKRRRRGRTIPPLALALGVVAVFGVTLGGRAVLQWLLASPDEWTPYVQAARDGAFHAEHWRRHVIATAAEARRPGWQRIADVDLDGRADVVTSTDEDGETQGLRVFLAGVDGSFRKVQIPCPDTGSRCNDGLVHDFDADGWPDLATVDRQGLAWFESTGRFESPACWERHSIDPNRHYSHDQVLWDLDGDGRQDIVLNRRPDRARWGEEVRGVTAYLAPGDPRTTWTPVEIGPCRDWALAIGDLDGNGRADVASFDHVFFHPGLPLRDGWDSQPFTLEYRPSDLRICDLDGDGRNDVALSEGHDHRVGEGRVAVEFAESLPGERPLRFQTVALARLRSPEGLDVGDLDRDGDLDLVAVSLNGIELWNEPGGDLVLFENLGGRQFGGPYAIQENRDRVGHKLEVADLNGDGHLDVFCHNVGATEPEVAALVVYYFVPPPEQDPGAAAGS